MFYFSFDITCLFDFIFCVLELRQKKCLRSHIQQQQNIKFNHLCVTTANHKLISLHRRTVYGLSAHCVYSIPYRFAWIRGLFRFALALFLSFCVSVFHNNTKYTNRRDVKMCRGESARALTRSFVCAFVLTMPMSLILCLCARVRVNVGIFHVHVDVDGLLCYWANPVCVCVLLFNLTRKKKHKISYDINCLQMVRVHAYNVVLVSICSVWMWRCVRV